MRAGHCVVHVPVHVHVHDAGDVWCGAEGWVGRCADVRVLYSAVSSVIFS
jgi:hypothetical protein